MPAFVAAIIAMTVPAGIPKRMASKLTPPHTPPFLAMLSNLALSWSDKPDAPMSFSTACGSRFSPKNLVAISSSPFSPISPATQLI